MRQIGVGTPGGAEALAIFISSSMMTGSLSGPLARIKVDEKNGFGMIEWQAVREVASRFLPKHTAATAWKHRNLSHIEQEGLPPVPKDRGAEQGDVNGPLECGLASGMVATETRRRIAARQAAGNLPWRVQETANFQLGVLEKLAGADDPQHALQKKGGLADLWYMDDGDIMCHRILVPSFLQEFDVANARVGAERNPQKTEVINYVNGLDAAPPEWRIRDVQNTAKVTTVTEGCITLGVAVGPRQHIADQLLAKADVIRAMHQRVQQCQDRQTEFALPRESLGVSRINHILQVHGHTILQEKRGAEIFDEVGQRPLERLFPGFTEDSLTQATLSWPVRNRVQKSARHRGSSTLV